MFTVGWAAGFEDGTAVDAMNASLSVDPGYVALIDEGAQYVEPTSVTRKMVLRLP